jgi:hypothetical protein
MSVEGMPTNMMLGATQPEMPTAAEVVQGAAEAEVPVAEAPVAAPEPAPEQPKERNSERFAALARKEAEVYRKQQAVRQQQAEIARQAEEVKAFRDLQRQAALNPLEALKALGLSYEQITEYMMNDNKPTPSLEVVSLRQELEEFKKQSQAERDAARKQAQELAAKEQQQIIEQFRGEVSEYVKQHSETYELTALYGADNLVYQVIEEAFNQSGKVLAIPEAAKMVEEHLEELAQQAQRTKKFAAKQSVTSPQASVAASAPKPGPTLSNSLSAVATGSPQRPRTEAERVAAALARLEGR